MTEVNDQYNETSTTEEQELEHVKAKDFSCPQCGAPIHFDPSTSTLECSYCGFKQVLNGVKSEEEFSIESVDEQEENSWKEETKLMRCKNCGAENVFSTTAITNTCPFCGSNQVVETNEIVGLKPHRVIPFKIDSQKAKSIYITWVKKRLYSPSKLKKEKIELNINGVYLPTWTYDTNSYSNYAGRLGKYYTVTVGSGKNRHTETRIRWFNISGAFQVDFDDLLVNAGVQISQDEINKISPYQTNDSFVYDKEFLAGFSAEHYHVNVKDGWSAAQVLAKPIIEKGILSQYSYDVVGSLSITTNYFNVKYKYVLIPTWIGNYDYNKKKYRFIVNGESGKLNGKAPTSPLKVAFTILFILIIVGVILLIAYNNGLFE